MHHPGHHSDLVVELLGVVAPDPVGDVEGTVEAQEEKVVRRDGLRFPGLADHEELGEDGHGLQVDGEGPEYLQGREAVVLQKRQACDGDQQELQAEGVVLAVKRFPEFHVDHVHGDVGAYQKNDLHHGVVGGDEGCEQVQVAGCEDKGEKDLALPRDTSTGLGPVDLQQQDDDGQQVGDVPQDAEDVHGGAGSLAVVGEGGRKTPRGALSSAERALPSC